MNTQDWITLAVALVAGGSGTAVTAKVHRAAVAVERLAAAVEGAAGAVAKDTTGAAS